MIAAAITAYDGSRSAYIEDASIGRLRFYMKGWGKEEDQGKSFLYPLESRPCSPSDLNDESGSNADSLFYSIRDDDRETYELYGSKL